MSRQWLRKYRVLVVDGDNEALDVSELRCTFNIESSLKEPNYADISIYNVTGATEQAIIKVGMRVIVQAGYENGPYGTIFDGYVIQPLWERENVVDYKITLRCIDSDIQLNNNHTESVVAARTDQIEAVRQMATSARTPITLDYITPQAEKKILPRGKVYFGDPKYYIRRFAQDNNADTLAKDNKVSVGRIDDQSDLGAAIELTPENGLIRVPQQSQDSVSMRCLLNPNIRSTLPPMLVKINNSIVRQIKLTQGQMPPTRLDRDGLYKVMMVNYIGDTRGNEWYCDIMGCTSDANGLMPLTFESRQTMGG
jgi:hypothetical protein